MEFPNLEIEIKKEVIVEPNTREWGYWVKGRVTMTFKTDSNIILIKERETKWFLADFVNLTGVEAAIKSLFATVEADRKAYLNLYNELQEMAKKVKADNFILKGEDS